MPTQYTLQLIEISIYGKWINFWPLHQLSLVLEEVPRRRRRATWPGFLYFHHFYWAPTFVVFVVNPFHKIREKNFNWSIHINTKSIYIYCLSKRQPILLVCQTKSTMNWSPAHLYKWNQLRVNVLIAKNFTNTIQCILKLFNMLVKFLIILLQ